MRALLLTSACLLSLAAPTARGTSIVPMTLAQIADAADVIVDGEVIEVQSRFVGPRILTFATLRVDRALKGELRGKDGARPTVTFAVLGGVVGSVGQRVPGAPVPQIHTRYVAALSNPDGPEGARHIIGFSQGLWRVDAQGKVVVVDGPVASPPPAVAVTELERRLVSPPAGEVGAP